MKISSARSRARRINGSKRAARPAASKHPYVWSIGIYTGASPFKLAPAPEIKNPVLSWSAVSDVPAAFVADPFMLRVNGDWYLFFEVMNSRSQKGEIGCALSADGLRWRYQQIVLAEPYHLSYPYVFTWQSEHYMIPETLPCGAVRLYKADPFPTNWSYVGTLINGELADPSIFYFAGRWWLFACATPYQHDTLRLYFAADLLGDWREHPASPIIEGDQRSARPGGRVLVLDGRIIRFTQDCYPIYGTQVRAFEISTLTPTSYHEQELAESPILQASGKGWNRSGMHTIDPHLTESGQWLACVDGVIRE